MSKHKIHGDFDRNAIERSEDGLILRVKINLTIEYKYWKFTVKNQITLTTGMMSKNCNSDNSSNFNYEFGDLDEDNKSYLWTTFSSSRTSISNSKRNIADLISDLIDESISDRINLYYYFKNFNKAATFDLELKVFGHELLYRNYNFYKQSTLKLLQDCKNILIQLDNDKTAHGVNKCVDELKDKLTSTLLIADSNNELKEDSASKINNSLILFSNNNQASDINITSPKSNKVKASCNII
jgi:hypothetical protein